MGYRTFTTGTVNVTNGSARVTLVGATVAEFNFRDGDDLQVVGNGSRIAIDALLPDTNQFDLVHPFDGTTATGATYTIYRNPAGWGSQEKLAGEVSTTVRLLVEGIPIAEEDLVAIEATRSEVETNAGTVASDKAAVATDKLSASDSAAAAATQVTLASAQRALAEAAAANIQSVSPGTVVGAANNAQALAGTVLDKAMNPANTAYVVGHKLLDAYRAGMWVFLGDGTVDEIPVEVSETGKVLIAQSRRTGKLVLDADAAVISAYRNAIWTLWGDGDPAAIPVDVSEDGKVLLARSAADGALILAGSTVSPPEAMAYVSAGVLRVVGGTGGDRVLNDDAGRTWLSAVPFSGSTLALYEDVDDLKHLVRVSYADGSIYPDGEVTLWTDDGQSNAEAQAGSGVAVLRSSYPWPERLRMPDLGVRLGLVTTGGASVQLDPEDFTALVALADALEGTGTHGTTGVASAAYAISAQAALRCGGWTPELLVFGNAEGGQLIANLLEDATSGYYGFDNVVAAVTKAAELVAAEGRRLVYRWQFMAQGESDSNDASLGSKHDTYRSQVDAAISSITGQDVPVRMLSAQMSSFLTDSSGARSILTYAKANAAAGLFFCLGPTYPYPFSDDWLHNTSVGHQMRGELAAVAAHTVENTGAWTPLHMLSATITGTNQITATLSEDAVNDEAAGVAAIANKGIAVPGRTVSAVTVTDDAMVIDLTTAAAGATTVQAAMVGHSGSRLSTTIPRSTIRSVASYGTHATGAAIRKWLCHQEVSIT